MKTNLLVLQLEKDPQLDAFDQLELKLVIEGLLDRLPNCPSGGKSLGSSINEDNLEFYISNVKDVEKLVKTILLKLPSKDHVRAFKIAVSTSQNRQQGFSEWKLLYASNGDNSFSLRHWTSKGYREMAQA